jgi:putative endopeptidase
MKLKSTTFICEAVLTIIVGLSIQIQDVYADTDNVSTVESQVDSSKDSNNEQTEISNNVSEFPLTISTQTTEQTKQQSPGGDWNVDPVKATPQQNFYDSVNGKWAESVPEGTDGTFDSLDAVSSKHITDYLNSINNGETTDATPEMTKIADYYQKDLKLYTDKDPDISELKRDLSEIENLKDYQDLSSHLVEFNQKGIALPFQFVGSTAKNSNSNMVFIMPPDLLIDSDTTDTVYSNDEHKKAAIDAYKLMIKTGLEKAGYSDYQVKMILKNAYTLNGVLYNKIHQGEGLLDNSMDIDSIDMDDVPDIINFKIDESEVEQKFQTINVDELLKKSFPDDAKFLNFNEDYVNGFNQTFSPSNFENLKAWLMASFIVNNHFYFGADINNLWATYNIKLANETDYAQMAFYDLANNFTQPLSVFYGKQFFGEKAKTEATEMVKQIISAYRERLQANTWLSKKAKAQAIDKLDNMYVRVGYPETISPMSNNALIDLEKSDSLYAMQEKINNYEIEQHLLNYYQPIDPDVWTMGSYSANAQYTSADNSINITAGILQKPFFSTDQTMSQNLGGIGVIIGHEITHGFDAHGSLMDKDGQLNDMWTAKDRKKFNKLVDKMTDEYDGIEYHGLKTNGELTVNENIADNGGLNVALQVAKKLDDFNAKEFFESYAIGYRSKYSEKYLEYLVNNEPHTIDPVRTNVGVQNIPDFYTTYNVKKGDGMWLDPDKRINIW